MIIINVLGNLGADAEVREKNGRKYASFRIASTSRRKGEPSTTWVSVMASCSDNLIPYLRKGQSVFVSGEAEIKTYETRDGKTGVDVSLFASSLALAGAKDAAQGVGNVPVNNVPTQQATTQQAQSNSPITGQYDLPF